MTKIAEELEQIWRSSLSRDNIQQSSLERESIVKWLLGQDRDFWENLAPRQLEIAKKGLDYRYQILRQRYLNTNPTQAYRNLIDRLGALVTLRQKIRAWISLSRDRQRAVADVLQEVIQEMLNSDRYIQQQMAWIAHCTRDERLRNRLLFASLEEYCLRPVRNQPLLIYRFVNYLRRQSKSGITQVPQAEVIRILSEEVVPEDAEGFLSLFDTQAVNIYQAHQTWQETQALRIKVQRVFEGYLTQKIGQVAVDWLRLYLAGRSQEAIAQRLEIPIQQVYRLREQVGYHAILVFALKEEPELVANWLETTPQEHNFGLTPQQWQGFWQQLTVIQQQIVEQLKAGQNLEEIGQNLELTKTQVKKQFKELYLLAQKIRSQ